MQGKVREQTRNTLEFESTKSKVFLKEERQAVRVHHEREHAQGIQDWIKNSFKNMPALAVTLTLEQHTGEAAAEAALLQYNKLLDRLAYGQAAYGRCELRTFWIKEGGGGSASHLHYHGVVEVPEGVDDTVFAQQCRAAWQEKIRVAGKSQNTFKPVFDLDGWAKYMTKGRSKGDRLDYLSPHATRLNFAKNTLH